jgi:hypothetical protein
MAMITKPPPSSIVTGNAKNEMQIPETCFNSHIDTHSNYVSFWLFVGGVITGVILSHFNIIF